ncbi:MAG: efflux RND transporter periplasmic adaptor subunit [Bacteroidales bacterium]|jgi:HlyD family secretion protein|nr:HlyD family secretion protein [Bacteroidota bacterium]HOF93617.1 HlyD family secretion protein [Bacteroidales bacterium]HOH24616.1 HlyD family secretion protein [Bacteroidales bacterium]HOQ58156.1 HlyD family secretion protein [Bacteroidales bacterium]
MKKSILLLLPIGLLCAACGKEKKQEIPLTQVRQETFYIDLYEEGDIQATQSKVISSPEISWRYGDLKITYVVDDGQEVEAGDTVVIFDPSEVRKAIVDAESRLEIHYAELEKMQAQQESDMEEMMADFEVTELSLEISRLEYESAEYEAVIKKKEIELNLERATIALEQAKSQIENRKKIQKEELTQKKLIISQAKSELEDAYNTLNLLFVTSPSPGIAIVSQNNTTGLKFQEGDQVWKGQPMIELPNLNELKAAIKINEVDIAKITKGQRVIIRPDAFSDSLYFGHIQTVANLAVNKERNSRIKVFPVDVLINSYPTDLMPGLTVSCRIIIDEIPDAVYIPLNALFKEGIQDIVYVKTATGFRIQEVKTGQSNADYIIIEEGLKAGENIAMANPFLVAEANKSSKKQAQ